MQQMTALEALTIAHWYALVARALSDASTLKGLSESEVYSLTLASQDCANTSSNLATQIAQVSFQSASKAFQDISDAASQATMTAQRLADDATKVNRLILIGSKVVALATAALTGNYSAALTALIGVVGAVANVHQGAKDPLAAAASAGA